MAGNAGVIAVSTQEAQTAVSHLNQKTSEVHSALDQLKREVEKMQNWWKGESGLAYVDRFVRLKTEVGKKIDDIIKEYGELCINAVKAHEDADKAIAGKINKA